jgi:citrate lyase subunit beta / citryl-CoA lyase
MRSLIITLGDDETSLAAALASGADALVINLELDTADARAAARDAAARFLRQARVQGAAPALIVRAAALSGSGSETDLDLAAVMPAAPHAIMLPKSLGGASVQHLSAKLAVHEALHGLADGATKIIAEATDTAEALFGMASYRGCSARLIGLAWGARSLRADIGAEDHRDASGAYAGPYRLARDMTLIAAAAAGVAAIDALLADVGNTEGLRAEAEAARRDGFAGKMAIDPYQARVINEVFLSRSIPRGQADRANPNDGAPDSGIR